VARRLLFPPGMDILPTPPSPAGPSAAINVPRPKDEETGADDPFLALLVGLLMPAIPVPAGVVAEPPTEQPTADAVDGPGPAPVAQAVAEEAQGPPAVGRDPFAQL
jgi:hypothetical protein